jgi:hypothetical protein
MVHPPRSLRRTVATTVAVYGSWLVTLALGGGIVFVWSGVLRELYIRLRLDKYGFTFYQDAVMVVLMIGWLGLAVAAEGWYRGGAATGRVAGRVVRLMSIEILLLLLGVALLRFV